MQNVDLILFNQKLLDLGIKGYANNDSLVQASNPVRDLWMPSLAIVNLPGRWNPEFMLIRNGRTVMIGTELYFNSLPEKEGGCIAIDYLGVKSGDTKGISGRPVRFLGFDKDYVYLHSWMFGVQPHKIYMKELLKFYLDNPYYF